MGPLSVLTVDRESKERGEIMLEQTENRKRKIAFFGLMLVNFIVMFLISGVGVYSYTIAAQYNSIASVSMVFALECVARSVTIPIGGTLGDKIGHKKLFMGALAVYIVSYTAAAFASGFWMFTIARMISGFAWGMFIMNVFVLISAIFGQEEAPKYSGYNQSLTTIAMIVAAPIAGVACGVNWRIMFYVSIILLVVGFVMCAYGIPKIPASSKGKTSLDYAGIAATAVTLIPFSLAMNWGNGYGWTSPMILGLLAVALVGFIFLIFAEKKASKPVIPIKLFKNKYYLCILLLMLIFSVLNGVGNYLPTYAQSVLGASSQVSGLINVPGLLIAVILTTWFGSYAAKTGKYKGMVMVWAIAALVGSIAWFALGLAGSLAMGMILIFAGAIPIAAVNSVNQIAPYTYPMVVLDPADLAEGLAFMGLAGALGSTLSGGICGAIMNSAGGLLAVFKVPVVCAVIMVALAVAFKDSKKNSDRSMVVNEDEDENRNIS